ncbi:Uncharacterised protein [Chlamydia trachomatis]|nr:Uncharacterised protein [Chlamydia trachomatis]CRH92513.1 Uncharacterised protein [Chlamydia trachomatis]
MVNVLGECVSAGDDVGLGAHGGSVADLSGGHGADTVDEGAEVEGLPVSLEAVGRWGRAGAQTVLDAVDDRAAFEDDGGRFEHEDTPRKAIRN